MHINIKAPNKIKKEKRDNAARFGIQQRRCLSGIKASWINT